VRKPGLIIITITACLLGMAAGQQAEKKPEAAQQQPPIKLNVLNVCTPAAEEQAILKTALAKARARAAFADDFEIARGRARVKDATSRYVRLRRDLAPQSPWLTVQYSMSRDDQNTIETLVLRMRDPKEFHELSIEDRVSAGAASPATVVATDTPASRIRVERLEKSSVALVRCPYADQSAYEPLFSEASDVMARYRKELGLRTDFRADINWLNGGEAKKTTTATGQEKRK